jgi:hypothetical protein
MDIMLSPLSGRHSATARPGIRRPRLSRLNPETSLEDPNAVYISVTKLRKLPAFLAHSQLKTHDFTVRGFVRGANICIPAFPCIPATPALSSSELKTHNSQLHSPVSRESLHFCISLFLQVPDIPTKP